ncbi:hypothetical protein CDD82_3754 [Ophiocordyceps australis]|uniref:L-2-hydroxyglutarate dehydrogenase, mitochondrial n=1 Tax=Ophiocordyceps australis TaxID=1399860 RepID=A0A2C5ZB30_9HYPO|nr:hypothetical protein CDD82_3754 [Ophiocordyceps australis]
MRLVGWKPVRQMGFSTTAKQQADFTHAVIGGGVVGVAIARQLAQRASATTVLLERHGALGTETTARNSEVVHAGIYYGAQSLKARLCIRGRQLLYALCEQHRVGHARVGKWIVAQTTGQRQALQRIFDLCRHQLDVPIAWLSEAHVRRHGQGVCAAQGALDSPSTGIVDAHGLVLALLGLYQEAGGLVACDSRVTAVTPLGPSSRPGSGGWQLDVCSASSASTSMTAESIVNAAGLGAVHVHNMFVPEHRRRRLYFAKGNYFSYAASRPSIGRLIYPAPEPDAAGLGTHLTLDLAGRLRFGPDVEWVHSPHDLAVTAHRLPLAVKEIKKYLPTIDPACLVPDYAGIRPKLSHQPAFNDFYIKSEPGFDGCINLLGIESPGLTSSLAIAEMVEELLYGTVTTS